MSSQSRTSPDRRSIDLCDEDETARFGAHLARQLEPGDCVLLSGPIGVGKSHLARAAIRFLMQINGEAEEDIPSPTYTLVQTYPAGDSEIWHADLYRLTDPAEVMELGLEEGFATGICFVEWPDRLGPDTPPDALFVQLDELGDGRRAILTGSLNHWEEKLKRLELSMKGTDDPRD